MTTIDEQKGRWYIIHTYSGQEERVKRNLDHRVDSMDFREKIFQVVVPTEEEIEIKGGRRRVRTAKGVPRLHPDTDGHGRRQLARGA